jgi:hypothetical protein
MEKGDLWLRNAQAATGFTERADQAQTPGQIWTNNFSKK